MKLSAKGIETVPLLLRDAYCILYEYIFDRYLICLENVQAAIWGAVKLVSRGLQSLRVVGWVELAKPNKRNKHRFFGNK